MIVDYKVVAARNEEDMPRKVAGSINSGWQPLVGGFVPEPTQVGSERYAQAMVKIVFDEPEAENSFRALKSMGSGVSSIENTIKSIKDHADYVADLDSLVDAIVVTGVREQLPRIELVLKYSKATASAAVLLGVQAITPLLTAITTATAALKADSNYNASLDSLVDGIDQIVATLIISNTAITNNYTL